MYRCCLLLLALSLAVPLLFAQTAGTAKVKVQGIAEDTDGQPVAGVKLEFQLRGDPKRQPAVTGADGKYAIEIASGMYDILAHMPDPKTPPYAGYAWLSQAETTLNVRVNRGKPEAVAEYDFLGEWRVTDEKGHAIGAASVRFEAQEISGKRARFPVFVVTDDGEKETDGQTRTDPAGRLPLRISEAHLAPDRVVAIIATVELTGFQPRVIHVYPEFQFSDTGHLYVAYPEEFQVHLKKQ